MSLQSCENKIILKMLKPYKRMKWDICLKYKRPLKDSQHSLKNVWKIHHKVINSTKAQFWKHFWKPYKIFNISDHVNNMLIIGEKKPWKKCIPRKV